MINVLIVHYNTPELTEACIKSINKHTPGCKIFIFDNSDKRPFTAHFDNVEIIDNTKEQKINFEEIINSFPNRKHTIDNHGSAKHMLSVQYFFDIFNKPFVLIDSDILLKKDISALADNRFIWVGMIEKQHYWFQIVRLAPYLLYINLPVCKQYGINFFKEHQIYKLDHTGPLYYDTGASFFEQCNQAGLPAYNLNINDYMIHFGGGSLTSIGKRDWKVWLEENKELWE